MTPERWQQVNDVFLAALETPGDRRRSFLDSACGGDVAMRTEVENLLASDETMGLGDFLEPPPSHLVSRLASATMDTAVGRQIGPYQLVEPIGEGGMGVVYLADQKTPVQRRVALKLIKLGMDTRNVVARFESERQALALMNHPNVARVFDAGSTEEGRPFFVMEYVPGMPITDYGDRHRLTTGDRLRLFVDVCHAVQHAHQKGIIHRDIKPSNVLVMMDDDQPVVKVIDFGVAKAAQQRLTERTLFTEQGQLIGTPGYMSPEQAEMTAFDIDTRTDIYSLGVLLYELLVGARPFDEELLRRAGFAELQRIIREVDPPKPSAKLGGLGDAAATAAQNRRTEPRTLARELIGDLDWITMKAIDKDRTRRYATASDFAADLARHLRDEPVLAGPPSVVYRLRKFSRRHSVGVALSAAAAAVLLAATFASAWWAQKADRERDAAQQARREAVALTEFFEYMLTSVNPAKARGRDVTVREILDKASEGITDAFPDQPLLEARLQHTLGTTYKALGVFEAAETHLRIAATLRGDKLGEEAPSTLRTSNNLGNALRNQGKFTEAEAAHRRTLAQRVRQFGETHVETLRTKYNLAEVLIDLGKYAEAESLLQEVLAIRLRDRGEENAVTLRTMNLSANLYVEQGKYADAEALYRRTLDIQRRVLGEDHHETLLSINNLAEVIARQGRYAEAEPMLRELLPLRRRILRDDRHPSVAETLYNLGGLRFMMGDLAEATSLLEEALDIAQKRVGENTAQVAVIYNSLGAVLGEKGETERAESLLRKGLEIRKQRLPRTHPYVAESLLDLGLLLTVSDRATEAEPLLREAVEIRGGHFGADHWLTADATSTLGGCLAVLRQYEAAEPLLLNSYSVIQAARGEQDVYSIKAHQRIVDLYEAWGKTDLAADHRAMRPAAGDE